MQTVSTYDLDAKMKDQGADVKVFSVHPGVVKTDLYEHTDTAKVFNCLFNLTFKVSKFYGKEFDLQCKLF